MLSRPSTSKPVGITRSELFSKRAEIACESDLSQALINCFSIFWTSDSSDSAAARELNNNPTSTKPNATSDTRFMPTSFSSLDILRSEPTSEKPVTATPAPPLCNFGRELPRHCVGPRGYRARTRGICCELTQSKGERVKSGGTALPPNAPKSDRNLPQ